MIVKQIWTANAYRNFNYLIACPQTGEALAIDPLDYRQCLRVASDNDWTITQIVNTHEHDDHIGGNNHVVEATGARLLAHAGAAQAIPDMDEGLTAGDSIKVGKTVDLEVLDTPGHTMSHLCLLSKTDVPSLFCGDTLFNAGAGNCHNGGHPNELYESFVSQLYRLPDHTLIYPGHDYFENNLGFTLDREPGNQKARELMATAAQQNPAEAMITSIALEKQVNTFFRLQNPEVIERIRIAFPELGPSPDSRSVFIKLRELRDSW
ncbi:MAG: hydroxyacylglutathione hydrolase [Pseudomonadota bacterium]